MNVVPVEGGRARARGDRRARRPARRPGFLADVAPLPGGRHVYAGLRRGRCPGRELRRPRPGKIAVQVFPAADPAPDVLPAVRSRLPGARAKRGGLAPAHDAAERSQGRPPSTPNGPEVWGPALPRRVSAGRAAAGRGQTDRCRYRPNSTTPGRSLGAPPSAGRANLGPELEPCGPPPGRWGPDAPPGPLSEARMAILTARRAARGWRLAPGRAAHRGGLRGPWKGLPELYHRPSDTGPDGPAPAAGSGGKIGGPFVACEEKKRAWMAHQRH